MGLFNFFKKNNDYIYSEGEDYDSSTDYDDEDDGEEYDTECERCGRNYNKERTDFNFDYFSECIHYHSNCFNHNFCINCMDEVIDDPDPGDYTGRCSRCGYTFDLCEAINDFYSRVDGEMGLTELWDNGELCSDCAVEDYREMQEMDDPFENED